MNNGAHTKIERVAAPSREEFIERYLNRNQPVILTGVADKWRAFKEWTPEYFKKIAGDSTITVHFNESGDFFEWYINPKNRVDLQIPLSELVDKLSSDPGDNRYYMTEHELSKVSPELLNDVDFGRYLYDIEPFEPLLFLGRDTCMPLHYHGTTESFLCQLHGRKRITLYSPNQHGYLYPPPWYQPSPLFSRIDGRTIFSGKADTKRFPRFRNAKPLEFWLEPGEMLFIPVHWWHLTRVDGYQVSVTHFWKAKLSCWRFPTPAFQVVAREVLFQTRRRLGNLRKS